MELYKNYIKKYQCVAFKISLEISGISVLNENQQTNKYVKTRHSRRDRFKCADIP